MGENGVENNIKIIVKLHCVLVISILSVFKRKSR